MRASLWIGVAAVMVVVVAVFPRWSVTEHKLQLKTYCSDARGLRAGAEVRLAGVRIGQVRSVRARPELRDHPAEVVMDIRTPYELRIPNDALASIETAGILGEAFVDIDTRDASGAAVQDGAVLSSRPTQSPTATEVLDRFADALKGRTAVAPQEKASSPPTGPPSK